MKNQFSYRVVTLCFLFFMTTHLNATNIFLGIEPSVTVEQDYADNEFDINLLPLIFEVEVTDNLFARLISMGNYHFGGTEGFSNVGVEVALPYYFGDMGEYPDTLFIAPIAGFSSNSLLSLSTHTYAVELGYPFVFSDGFSLIFAFQYGVSNFIYDSGITTSTEHIGLKVRIGYWLE